MKEDWKKESREEVDNLIDLARYRMEKYPQGLPEEEKKKLEKARDIVPDEGKSKKKGGS